MNIFNFYGSILKLSLIITFKTFSENFIFSFASPQTLKISHKWISHKFLIIWTCFVMLQLKISIIRYRMLVGYQSHKNILHVNIVTWTISENSSPLNNSSFYFEVCQLLTYSHEFNFTNRKYCITFPCNCPIIPTSGFVNWRNKKQTQVQSET